VASLLLRFADPLAGRITVGDVDLAGCDRPNGAARSPGSRNARRCSAAPSREHRARSARGRVGAAARMAGAHEFIERLESGYETVVGDGGTPLSPARPAASRSRAPSRETPRC
jgi:ATP-binding cassette subfamily B protein